MLANECQFFFFDVFSTASPLFYMLSGCGIQLYMQTFNYKEDVPACLSQTPKLAIYTQAKNAKN